MEKYAEILAEPSLYQEVPSYRLKASYTSILNHFTSQSLSNHSQLITSQNEDISSITFHYSSLYTRARTITQII
jgi:hypothetical protein